MNTPSMQRQEWLEKAMYNFRLYFAECGYTVPDNVRISVGIPKGMHGQKKAIGQCWSSAMSSDGHFEIFVSPELGKEKDVLETIAHELIHATVGIKAGHKGAFKVCALGYTVRTTEKWLAMGDPICPVDNVGMN